jgi:CHASE3 domain sensor protein
MSDANSRWQDFEEIGEAGVRQNLALRIYGEDNKKLAAAWLEHKASLANAASQAESLALAREA